MGSCDYVKEEEQRVQHARVREQAVVQGSGSLPCLFQQRLIKEEKKEVRSFGRMSLAFITIVRGPGQKDFAK